MHSFLEWSLSLLLLFINYFTNNCDAANIGQFWHLTDLHIDDRYSEKGNPDYMCWESGYDGVNSNHRPGMFGDFRCDSPYRLIESALGAMKDILPNPDFIIWTGDDTAHIDDSYFSTQIVVDVIANLTNEIKNKFPDTHVLPVLGNHDLFPKNQIGPGPSELQSKVADLWKDWLDCFGEYQNFKENGSYVANLNGTKISVVGLNTLLWYKNNKITNDDPTATDPGNQFKWLSQQLEFLEKQKRKAYLIGHIPPGVFERYFEKEEGFYWYQPRYNEQYIELVQKYGSKVIAGQFFGHHHTDSIRVFLSENETPISFALIAPGVSPMKSTLSPETGANNPGIRLITYNRDTGDVLESATYFLDLKRANEINEANWSHEYNLTDILGLKSINAETLYEATQRLKNDEDLFKKYYPVNTVQYENVSSCSLQCHKTQLCAMTNIGYADFSICNVVNKPI